MTNNWNNHIQGRNGDARLEIFRLRSEPMSLSFGKRQPDHFDFAVHYRKAFTAAEREAALEKLIATPASVETMLPFVNSFFESTAPAIL